MNNQIEYEKHTVEKMVSLYCRRSEGNKELCSTCKDLLDYAYNRLDDCIYGNSKPPCNRCSTYCYKPAMRDRIKQVMRFSGPRLMLYAPVATLKHMLQRIQGA